MVATPQKIGKYDVIAPLGQGAMGVVYKAFDPLIKRFVALKTIQPGFIAPQDDDSSMRFQREAQAAGKLTHPNIVAIYEYGEDQGRAYIAMEYVEGRTLGDLFKQDHRFNLTDIHKVLSGVLSALDYSHGMGVIHRDIKPGNIMLDDAGTVKVMDFGVAHLQSSDMTMTGTILGTPGYMSPEQLLGEPVEPRSDLYSTGIVLYELLVGERAFTGSTFSSVIYKVFNSELSPPSRLKPTVPGTVDDLVAKACAKKAEERYQSANEFAAALDQALVHQLSAQKVPDDTPTLLASKPVIAPAIAGPKRKTGKTWIAAAVLAAVGIALMVWFTRSVDRPKSEKVVVSKQTAFKDCEACPEMVVIPPGQFFQGSSQSESNRQPTEGPRRLVDIDYALAVSRFEITKAQFARFAAETGHEGIGCSTYDGSWQMDTDRSWQSPGFEQDDDHPVTCVSWKDADAYIRWLSNKTGKTYRLLSASEWEYAARSGSTAGKEIQADPSRTCESANVADQTAGETYPGWEIFECRDNHVHTAPVGTFEANAFNLHDMMGNLFEWVSDCWNDGYTDAPRDGSAWLDGNCGQRVLRGGSWFTSPGYVRVSFRNRFIPEDRSSSFGFRIARKP